MSPLNFQSHNQLRSLPRDVFESTALESVDLSFNEFVAMPTSALTEASASVRRLTYYLYDFPSWLWIKKLKKVLISLQRPENNVETFLSF